MIYIRENMIAYRKNRLEELAKRTDFNYVDLSNEQENQLIESILNMSIEIQNLLIFKNYYNHSFNELEDILEMENAKGEYLNLVCVLSEILELDDKVISNNSMKKVCKQVAQKINEEINKEFEFSKKTKERSVFKVISFINKRVASIVLILLIGSSMLVGANAYANGKIFEWIINTFEEYTSFNISEENKLNKKDVDIEIVYIPNGFEFRNKTVSDSADIYYYKNGKKHLIIKFIYDSIDTGLNTENTLRDEFELGSVKVITWEKAKQKYFIAQKNGIACQIYGNITKDEFIEIYNNISIN